MAQEDLTRHRLTPSISIWIYTRARHGHAGRNHRLRPVVHLDRNAAGLADVRNLAPVRCDHRLAGVGTIHSEKLHVVERYTRDSYDTVRYEVTMEDPEVFTKPWRQQEAFRLRPGERLREYECIENNEDLVRFEKLLQTDPALRHP
jgi:hypothetical protein